jgi:NADH-quinone oxidoreductase subunit A
MDVRAYLPVLMLMGFVVLNAVVMLAASHFTVRSRPTPVKQTPYESGIPALGSARERFSVKF